MLHRVPRNERWVLKTEAERGWEEKGVLVRIKASMRGMQESMWEADEVKVRWAVEGFVAI